MCYRQGSDANSVLSSAKCFPYLANEGSGLFFFFLLNSVPFSGFCTLMLRIPDLNASKGQARYGGAELSRCCRLTWRECDQWKVTRLLVLIKPELIENIIVINIYHTVNSISI